jgi:hypothetical protein
MLIVKRLAVLGAEIISQAALLGLVLISLFGYDRHAFGRSLLVYAIWILVMLLTTGYVVTTAISRTIWKGSKLWL